MVGQDIADSPKAEDLASISELHGDMTETQSQDSKMSDPSIHSGSLNVNGPGKPDKPRPHVCATCNRSFARLEHLKRHERSHTKEKPFECPECARCFARRDLLLRHQQKLHMTATPSSRPKNARRESTGAAGATNRIRKNSIAGVSNTMRPRANTISHIDGSAAGIMNSVSTPPTRSGHSGHAYHPSLGSMSEASNFDSRGFGATHPGSNALLKIETSGLPMDLSGGLRTAPVYSNFATDFGFGDFVVGSGATINPAQLHFAGSPQRIGHDSPSSPFNQSFHRMSSVTDSVIEDDSNFDWINGFDTTVPLGNMSESVMDESSPSAMSTTSQSGASEPMPEKSTQLPTSSVNWQNPFPHPATQPAQFTADFVSHAFHDLSMPQETISPKSLVTQNQYIDPTFSSSPVTTSMDPSMMGGHSQMPYEIPILSQNPHNTHY